MLKHTVAVSKPKQSSFLSTTCLPDSVSRHSTVWITSFASTPYAPTFCTAEAPTSPGMLKQDFQVPQVRMQYTSQQNQSISLQHLSNYECIRFILVVSYQILYCGMENQSVKIVYEKEIASPPICSTSLLRNSSERYIFIRLLDGGIFRKKSGLCRNTEGGVSRNVFIFFKHNIKAKAVCCGYNSVSC